MDAEERSAHCSRIKYFAFVAKPSKVPIVWLTSSYITTDVSAFRSFSSKIGSLTYVVHEDHKRLLSKCQKKTSAGDWLSSQARLAGSDRPQLVHVCTTILSCLLQSRNTMHSSRVVRRPPQKRGRSTGAPKATFMICQALNANEEPKN